MIEIIKPGTKEKISCKSCGCLFSYEKEDIEIVARQPETPMFNVMMNYEVLANIYKSRKDHKLDEWRNFCKWIEELPYSELITGGVE